MSKIFIAAFVIFVLISVPLYAIYIRVMRGNKSSKPFLVNICSFFCLVVLGAVFCLSQSASAAEVTADLVSSDGLVKGIGYFSAALAVGMSGIGGGIAVSSSASAALGAISENESTFGKALIFVGMGEGVALYGLLIAFMIISNL